MEIKMEILRIGCLTMEFKKSHIKEQLSKKHVSRDSRKLLYYEMCTRGRTTNHVFEITTKSQFHIRTFHLWQETERDFFTQENFWVWFQHILNVIWYRWNLLQIITLQRDFGDYGTPFSTWLIYNHLQTLWTDDEVFWRKFAVTTTRE